MRSARTRVGPNAVLQPLALLESVMDPQRARALVADALGAAVYEPPAEPVDEVAVARLFRRLRLALGDEAGGQLLHAAGVQTALYLLRHRIPALAQRVLRALPAAVALDLLARAVARNAWTFAGSGSFEYIRGRPGAFVVRNGPLCRAPASHPVCDFYAGTFETLLRRLVAHGAHVQEIECRAAGDAACVFRLELDGKPSHARSPPESP